MHVNELHTQYLVIKPAIDKLNLFFPFPQSIISINSLVLNKNNQILHDYKAYKMWHDQYVPNYSVARGIRNVITHIKVTFTEGKRESYVI